MSELDKVEYEKLAEIASQLAVALNRGGSSTEVSARLSSTTSRIETLQHEGIFDSEHSEKRKSRLSQDAAIAAMVEQETRLNEDEKLAYAELLEQEAFEKKDFKKLEYFYAHSYDKLSDAGKAQMSARIDEGIARGNFERDDLPSAVQKRHSKSNESKEVVTPDSKVKDQQASFEEHNHAPQTPTETETATHQDTALLASAFEGVSFAATDLPHSAPESTERTV